MIQRGPFQTSTPSQQRTNTIRPLCAAVALVSIVLCACTSVSSDEESLGKQEAPLRAGESYVGCFTDAPTRALPVSLGPGWGIEACLDMARYGKFAYAGLQYYGECFVGNNLGYSRVSDAECNTPCPVWGTCGGAWRNSIYATGISPPPSAPGGTVITGGHRLSAGQSWASPDGRFHLDYQADGNLVLYQNGVGHIWTTWTNGTSPGRAEMQTDGNFVVYNSGGGVPWHANTYNNPGAYLKLQNDGNMVIYNSGGGVLWQTHTGGR